MITDKTARRLGAKFLKEQGCPKLVKMVEDYLCVERIFKTAAKTLGKKKLKQLYLALPKSLKSYFLYFLNGYNEFRLEKDINRIWPKFHYVHTDSRPERRKDFQQLMKELDEALQRYFKR